MRLLRLLTVVTALLPTFPSYATTDSGVPLWPIYYQSDDGSHIEVAASLYGKHDDQQHLGSVFWGDDYFAIGGAIKIGLFCRRVIRFFVVSSCSKGLYKNLSQLEGIWRVYGSLLCVRNACGRVGKCDPLFDRDLFRSGGRFDADSIQPLKKFR